MALSDSSWETRSLSPLLSSLGGAAGAGDGIELGAGVLGGAAVVGVGEGIVGGGRLVCGGTITGGAFVP